MKRGICIGLLAVGVLLIVLSSLAGAQGPGPQTQTGTWATLGTAFTYQGELRTASGPVSGTCDFQFSLWDAQTNGAQVGSAQAVNGVSIVNGRFAAQLDFGASAFSGDARYLQIAVRCPSGSGGYTMLAPRQPLTAAPYALGLRPGATISGTGGHPAYAALALRNDAGYGLHVLSAGWDGVRVVSAGYSGVYVDSAHTGVRVYSVTHGLAVSSAETGVKVYSASFDGVDIDSATYSGLNVDTAMTGVNVGSATTGLNVGSAGAFGVHVGSADTGLYVYSATTGLLVNSASDNGVYVGRADNGVHVNYADFNGLSVYSATRAGVYVFSAGQDGVQVCTNIPGSGCTTSSGHHGVELDNIDDDGVYVGQAGGNGLYVGTAITGVHVYSATSGLIVDSADRNGVRVDRAGVAGVYVAEADVAGVWVSQAGEYGVGVYRAGNPSYLTMSTFPSGFEVEGAEGYGLYVGRADMDGVYVWSAGGDGVDVRLAGGDGVDATSTNASAYGGRFVNSATGGAGLYARGGNNTAPDLVLGGNSSTSDDGRIRSDTTFTSSDIFLISNDAVQIELDSDDNESGNFWILDGDDNTVFSVNENGDMTAIGTKNALVTTQDYGQRKLYAMESPQNWFEDFGSAQLVNGQATVAIEPIFAQTVNLTGTYHVFLTPLGDCALYVAAKTPASFTVKAMGGQTCSIAFDYRIVAKRLGYESLRLDSAATGGGTP